MALDLIDSVKPATQLPRNRWSGAEPGPSAGQVLSVMEESAIRQRASAGLSAPVFYVSAMVVSAALSIFGSHFWGLLGLAGLVVWPALAVMHYEMSGMAWAGWSTCLRKPLASPIKSAPDSARGE